MLFNQKINSRKVVGNMQLTKCNNGHFYDAEKYSSCPHCKEKLEEAMRQSENTVISGNNNDSFVNNKVNRSYTPVCGWLVGISGEKYGYSFELLASDNSIGSGKSNDIIISDDSYLCEKNHAIIIFDTSQNLFYVNIMNSEGAVYINNTEVKENMYIDYMDVLQLGGSSYMLVPLCRDGFTWWDDREIEEVQQNYPQQHDTCEYSYDFYTEENTQTANEENVSLPWICPLCNTINSSMISYCKSCGAEHKN